jgi:hypothetical protein
LSIFAGDRAKRSRRQGHWDDAAYCEPLNHLMRVCKEKLGSRKALDVYELKDLQVGLENIDDGLDKDSLFCQEALDVINSEDHLDDEEHIETF